MAGALVVLVIGLRSGADLAAREAALLAACREACAADRDRAQAHTDAAGVDHAEAVELHAHALRELADRCVLTVPARDRLVVTRVR